MGDDDDDDIWLTVNCSSQLFAPTYINLLKKYLTPLTTFHFTLL